MATTADVAAAHAHCARTVASHYENFPVASTLLPARLRRPVAAIYAFARGADDFADEGDDATEARLAALDDWAGMLDAAARGEPPDHPVFVALADVLERHPLPVGLLHDLVEAFRMDVRQARWPDFAALLHYCRHSANPVGRLLLALNGTAHERALEASDRVCSALQLINFWQDLAQDYDENDRIYLPQDEMAAYGVNEIHLRDRVADDALRGLMAFQYQRARKLMQDGAGLAADIGGRMGLEVAVVVNGGLRILEKLEHGGDPFARPRLDRTDWLRLGWRALGTRFRHTS